jgi:hypothetical protein
MTVRLKFLLVVFLAVCLLLGETQTVRVARTSLASDPPGIIWWVLGAGGGPASGGQIMLNATLGQPVVGTSSGGATMLKAGYWSAAPVSGTGVYLPLLRK